MKRSKSQLNAINYAYRDRLERRRTAGKALYGWIETGGLSEYYAIRLKKAIEDGFSGEFVETTGGFKEARHAINWNAVRGGYRWVWTYTAFERYRAAVRAQKSPYYRRRLAKLGINWIYVQRPYGTDGIELD